MMKILETEGLDLDLPHIPPDSEETIFDFLVDEDGKWAHWSSKVSGRLYSLFFAFAYVFFL